MTSARRALTACLSAVFVELVLQLRAVLAYDPNETFRKGAYVLSVEGGGWQAARRRPSFRCDRSRAFPNGGVPSTAINFSRSAASLPCVEVGGADLRVREIKSSFTFLVFGGLGVSSS